MRFNRATSRLKRLVVVGHSGSVSLDALRWITDVGAVFVQVDHDANLVTMSAPARHHEPALRRAQALASGSDTGLVGGAVVDLLVGSGVEVLALTRTAEGARRLVDRGAVAVRGDLREPATWAGRVADVDLVIHAGLPRMVPPLRSRRLRRLTREAAHAAGVLSDAALGKDVVMASCALADRSGPLQIAGPARAAEHALRGPGLRVVRLP